MAGLLGTVDVHVAAEEATVDFGRRLEPLDLASVGTRPVLQCVLRSEHEVDLRNLGPPALTDLAVRAGGVDELATERISGPRREQPG